VDKSQFRVLVVDDYEPWRRYLSTALGKQEGLNVIAELSDGLQAVQKAEELRPDLILLDIGLPTLNGIEVARQIRKVCPASKIVFVSDNRSADIANEALSTGAIGYVVKSDAASDLLPAVKAVIEGKRFVSASLASRLNGPPDPQTGAHFHRGDLVTFAPTQNVGSTREHEVAFYSDGTSFLYGFTEFIGAALKAGNSAIVLATESHRDRLLSTLQANGLDIGIAIEQGRYIAVDAADTLSTFMINGLPDPVRFSNVARDLVLTAAKAAQGEQRRVVVCGECAPLLWVQGNAEAAIRLEELWDKIARTYDVATLCGYSRASFQGGIGSYVYKKICAQHAVAHSL
jgi:DNA-binding NarL/FixJ family response regulator